MDWIDNPVLSYKLVCDGNDPLTNAFVVVRNRTTFVEGILTRLKLAARADDWAGWQLFDADWIKVEGQPDMAFVAIAPGLGDVTVADVRSFVAEKRKRERKAA